MGTPEEKRELSVRSNLFKGVLSGLERANHAKYSPQIDANKELDYIWGNTFSLSKKLIPSDSQPSVR
jgi:hypothetical protein